MKKVYRNSIDICGKIMFAWLVFSTFQYLYSGGLWGSIKMLSQSPNHSVAWLLFGFFNVIQIILSTIGIFVIIPLLLKGRPLGLALGIIYSFIGSNINPLLYIVPEEMLATEPYNSPSWVLTTITLLYVIFTLGILLLFYLNRRVTRSSKKPHGHHVQPTAEKFGSG